MPIKTLLFGASSGASSVLSTDTEDREFLGILDNDENKHGSYVCGLPVFSPEALSQFDFDEILIATQWGHIVYDQLVNTLMVPPQKIRMPPKKQLKRQTSSPFETVEGRNFGHAIIREITASAREADLPLVVDFGTLLGLVRDGSIIPWDDDIDFALPSEFAAKSVEVIKGFVKATTIERFVLEVKCDVHDRLTSLLLSLPEDFNQFERFYTSISFRECIGEESIHLPSVGMWHSPAVHFRSTETFFWGDTELQVPANYEDYLTYVYGDWRTVKREFTQLDYANLKHVSFDEVNRAQITNIEEEDRVCP